MANVTCEYDEGTDANNLATSSADNSSTGRRVRRSEAILRQAAECVSRGQTFQTVSDMFHIPISTIRFFMARKGILPRRKRGRSAVLPLIVTTGGNGVPAQTSFVLTGNAAATAPTFQVTSISNATRTNNETAKPTLASMVSHSRSSSPTEPPFHFANYKLPELRPKLV